MDPGPSFRVGRRAVRFAPRTGLLQHPARRPTRQNWKAIISHNSRPARPCRICWRPRRSATGASPRLRIESCWPPLWRGAGSEADAPGLGRRPAPHAERSELAPSRRCRRDSCSARPWSPRMKRFAEVARVALSSVADNAKLRTRDSVRLDAAWPPCLAGLSRVRSGNIRVPARSHLDTELPVTTPSGRRRGARRESRAHARATRQR